MNGLEIQIRRATAADRAAIRRILASVWGEDDYVQDRLPEWIRDRRGGLWLALLDGRPAGIGKLTVFPDGQAWVHGLRVAPWARRSGVGSALLRHRLDRARALGARVARLDTHHTNTPVLRMARRLGMRRIATLTFWRARARAGTRPARATLRDLPRLWRIAHEASRRAPVFARDPRARRLLDRDLLAEAIRRGWCLKVDRPRTAFALFSEGERLYIQTLAGPPMPCVRCSGCCAPRHPLAA
jgi:ribosomal protein S18 acetylase RimI-like enzyme